MHHQFHMLLDHGDMYCSLQGFQSRHGMVLKEISVAYDEDGETRTRSFRPPFAWDLLDDKFKQTNEWMTKHFHGLEWDEGRIPYTQIKRTLSDLLLQSPDAVAYVSGVEQARWLRDLTGDCKLEICDLQESYGCPSFRKLRVLYGEKHACEGIEHHSVCARQNAQLLRAWFRDRQKQR